jgi:hypothetical protein
VDSEFAPSDIELIVGKESRTADSLAVHACTVGAAQIAKQEKAVGLDNHAVVFGNALVFQPQIAIGFAAHERQILDEKDGWTSFQGYQLRSHGLSPARDFNLN